MRRFLLLAVLVAACTTAPVREQPRVVEPERVTLLIRGEPVPFRDPQVLSTSEDNQEFVIALTVDFPPGPDPHEAELRSGTTRLRSRESGTGEDQGEYWFRSDAANACSIAYTLHTAAVEREPWPVLMRCRLDPERWLSTSDARIPLRFTLANDGPVGFWLRTGGRFVPGVGRDNHFRFEVEHDGRPLPIADLASFGGLDDYREIPPGECADTVVNLADWCEIREPGEYTVHATYEAELLPLDEDPEAPRSWLWEEHVLRRIDLHADAEIHVD